MGDSADPAPEAEVVVRDSVHFLCQRCVSRGVRPLDCSLRVSGSLYNLHTDTITQLLPLNRAPVKAGGRHGYFQLACFSGQVVQARWKNIRRFAISEPPLSED